MFISWYSQLILRAISLTYFQNHTIKNAKIYTSEWFSTCDKFHYNQKLLNNVQSFIFCFFFTSSLFLTLLFQYLLLWVIFTVKTELNDRMEILTYVEFNGNSIIATHFKNTLKYKNQRTQNPQSIGFFLTHCQRREGHGQWLRWKLFYATKVKM